MKPVLWMTLLLMPCAGCTTFALSRHTVNQSKSISAARYHEVLHNLAITAHNPGELPSFASLSGGTVNVTNTWGFDPTTDWTASAFTKQILTLSGKHTPDQQWTVNPVAEVPQLEALWYACGWAVSGPPPIGSPAWNRLRAPCRNDDDQCHFGVEDKLRMLPPNWLGKGHRGDVPRNAVYSAHCAGTYVWITPESMMAMSDFVLVILDIASVDLQSVIWQRPVANIDVNLTPNMTCPPAGSGSAPSSLPEPLPPICTPTSLQTPAGPNAKPPAGNGTNAGPATGTITYQVAIRQLDDANKTIMVPTPGQPATTPTFCFGNAEAPAPRANLMAAGTNQAPSTAIVAPPTRRYMLNRSKLYSLQAQGIR